MARLQEVPYVLRHIGAWTFTKRVLAEVVQDGVFNMGAAVAFYWLLALLPLIVFLLTLAPLMPQQAQDRTKLEVRAWVQANLPPPATKPVLENVEDILERPRGGLLSIGLLATLWAASNGINATMTALDRCYDITKPRNFLVQRGVSILITLGFVVGALLVILLIPVTSLIQEIVEHTTTFDSSGWVAWLIGPKSYFFNFVRYSIAISLVVVMVSTVYQFGGSVRRRWTLMTPGAVFTVFGVILAAYGFGWYIESFGAKSYNQAYGTLAGVVILLLTLYLYACVFLIGAEINSEIDYIIVGTKTPEATDPLPRLHPRENIERFRKQLEARQASTRI